MWVEISEPDADRLGITEGDIVRVTSRRGSIQAPARIAHTVMPARSPAWTPAGASSMTRQSSGSVTSSSAALR